MKDLLFYPCIITQGLLTKVFHIQLWDVFPYSPKRRFIWLKTVLRITESQSMLSWKIFIGTVESTSWSCTGHLKNDTVCLRTLSRHLLSSLKLAADSFPGEPGQCPTTLWGKKLLPDYPTETSSNQLQAGLLSPDLDHKSEEKQYLPLCFPSLNDTKRYLLSLFSELNKTSIPIAFIYLFSVYN